MAAGPWTARQAARLSERLTELRSSRNWSLRQLGDRAGISPNTVKGLEAGAQPDLGTLLALQRAFGLTSIEALLGPGPGSAELALLGIEGPARAS